MSNNKINQYAAFISSQSAINNIINEVKKPVDPEKAAKVAERDHKFNAKQADERLKFHSNMADNHAIHSEVVGEDGDESGAEDHKWIGSMHKEAADKFKEALKHKNDKENFANHFKQAMVSGQEANIFTNRIGKPHNYIPKSKG